MYSVNQKSLIIYKVTCAKEERLIKSVLMNLFHKIDNLIAKDLMSIVELRKVMG